MKTTIDIPEPLYQRAKIRATERRQTLQEIVLTSLRRELAHSPASESRKIPVDSAGSGWANRTLRPGFRRYFESGALSGGTDSTVIVAEDRSSREAALL